MLYEVITQDHLQVLVDLFRDFDVHVLEIHLVARFEKRGFVPVAVVRCRRIDAVDSYNFV